MFRCEVCGKRADEHHIVHKSQGGMDFPLNIMYLCQEHHRGKNGPHKNKTTDLKYKLQMQEKLGNLLNREYYREQELSTLLQMNNGKVRKLLKTIKLYKEGYRASDIIFKLMGDNEYDEFMLEEFCGFIANF